MTQKSKFEVGDVVELKSGGPVMTVFDVEFSKPSKSQRSSCDMFVKEEEPEPELEIKYICKWFAGKKSERDLFKEDMLELANSNSKK